MDIKQIPNAIKNRIAKEIPNNSILSGIKQGLSNLPQTNNVLDAYQQMLSNEAIPKPIRMLGQVASNTPMVGLQAINQNVQNPISPADAALTFAGTAPKLGPESEEALRKISTDLIKRNPITLEDMGIFLKSFNEQTPIPQKVVATMSPAQRAVEMISLLPEELKIPKINLLGKAKITK